MNKKNISFHFSISNQTMDDVRQLYGKFVDKYPHLSMSTGFLTEEESSTEVNPGHVLHHCFMPKDLLLKKKRPTDVPLFFESICCNIRCWYGENEKDLEADRRDMLCHIKKFNGVSVFLGAIEGGVAKEMALAKEVGLNNVIHIQ